MFLSFWAGTGIVNSCNRFLLFFPQYIRQPITHESYSALLYIICDKASVIKMLYTKSLKHS
jgi:hypothetical protein